MNSSATPRVRQAAVADHPALAAIEVEAGRLFREIGMDAVADDDPPGLDELAEAAMIWVAVDEDDRPIGYAWADLVDGHAHLEQLSVLPDHGGGGVGTALLDALAGWAGARGDREITLTTFRDVPFNAPLYAKRGYEVVPEAKWTAALRELVAHETDRGLDPTTRVVMRRPLS